MSGFYGGGPNKQKEIYVSIQELTEEISESNEISSNQNKIMIVLTFVMAIVAIIELIKFF